MNLRVQSKTTSILVRQLTCLLDIQKENNDSELGQRVVTKMTCEDKGWFMMERIRWWLNQRTATSKHNEGSCFVQSYGLWMMRAHSRASFYLAYTEYQSHWVLWPMETQSPGSSAAACSPPKGANWPKCLYLKRKGIKRWESKEFRNKMRANNISIGFIRWQLFLKVIFGQQPFSHDSQCTIKFWTDQLSW